MATAAFHPHQPLQMRRQTHSPVIGHQQPVFRPHQRSLSQQHLVSEPSSPYGGAVDDIFQVSPPKRQRLSMDDGRRKRSSSLVQSPVPTAALHSRTPPPGALSRDMRARMSASPAAGDAKRGPSLARAVAAATSAPAVVDDTSSPTAATPAAANKPRRVRTGCLTCRERHLKCDEGTPDCLNCRKSNRECKRGVRLNFIDVQVKSPPYIPPTVEWLVRFEDESRAIASEYRGGLGRYAYIDTRTITPPREAELEPVLQQHRQDVGNKSALAMISETSTAMTSVSLYAASPVDNPVDRRYTDFQMAMAQGLEHQQQSATDALSQQHHHHNQQQHQPRHQTQHQHRNSDVSNVTSAPVPQGIVSVSKTSTRITQDGNIGQALAPECLVSPTSSENAITGERDCLSSPEEIRYMQVFVEEVGIWMDSFDKDKHFSRVIPYLALKSPMLLNAFLACGAKQLTLVRPNENLHDHRALCYYDTATTQLLRSLSNPDRNMAECATTAVVLNVYEIMSDKPAKRMNHIAGARALIRECGWNAKTKGVGSACFWLNIGMEVLSCLAFNWQTAWHPDDWGLDLAFLNEEASDGAAAKEDEEQKRHDANAFGSSGDDEEEWVHRIFYIVAKIASFRANIPRFQEPSRHDEQVRLQSRLAEWNRLKGLCDAWASNCPRPMRPFGHLHASQTQSQSAFPNVWLIKRAAVIGRLFYHTAMCLLAQINPVEPRDSEENTAMQLHHAHQVCGIVAHTKDNGIASVALRSLAIAAAVLRDRREQEEVVAIFDRITRETGWRLGKVYLELEKGWGWKPEPPNREVGANNNNNNNNKGSSNTNTNINTSTNVNSSSNNINNNNNSNSSSSSNNNIGSGSGSVSAAAAAPVSAPTSAPSSVAATAAPLHPQSQAAPVPTNPLANPTPMRHPPPKLQQPRNNPSPRPQQSQQRSSGLVPAVASVAAMSATVTTGPLQPSLLTTSFPSMQQQQQQQQQQQFYSPHHQHAPQVIGGGQTQQPSMARPLVNPLLMRADFSLPDHPYQNWYQPPNHTSQFSSHSFWSG